ALRTLAASSRQDIEGECGKPAPRLRYDLRRGRRLCMYVSRGGLPASAASQGPAPCKQWKSNVCMIPAHLLENAALVANVSQRLRCVFSAHPVQEKLQIWPRFVARLLLQPSRGMVIA